MKGIGLAAFALCVWVGAALPAEASLTPSGTTLWTFASGDFAIAVEVIPGSALGTMTLVNTANGRSAVGTLYPAAVVDRPHGSLDELIVDGFFQNDAMYPLLGLGELDPNITIPYQPVVHIGLGDLDGVAFDGAIPSFNGLFLMPVNPPPLGVFELNSLVITHYEVRGTLLPVVQTFSIDALPEPATALLALPLLGLIAGRRRATGA